MQMSMENYQAAGDLTDIVRASGGVGGGSSSSIPPNNDEQPPISSSVSDWRFPSSDLMNFQSGILVGDTATATATDDFGDPFSNLRDPLLHELHHHHNIGSSSADGSGAGFFFNTPQNSSSTTPTTSIIGHGRETNRSVFGVPQKTIISRRRLDDDHDDDDDQMTMMMKRSANSASCNIFSRMLQISPNNAAKTTATTTLPLSPCGSPVQLQAAAAAVASPSSRGSIININANSLSKGCSLVDNTTCLQISSPRNPGIKRRKSQAKKVVCIPAPAPANSRPSGEIVPSDLWAWRKYGQKPIKGSPYPRGYYRCSSSKGCSARKQVERSRTDPNMLVITYTSEHNHPWPTQRNALAGSTRAQPLKSNQRTTTNLLNEEFKDINNILSEGSTSISTSTSSAFVKEEMLEDMEDEKELLEMDEGDDQFSEGFPSGYKPEMPDSSNLQPCHEDFFADLGEIESTDPLSLLLLNQEFRSSGSADDHQELMRGGIKALDPFSIFDWPTSAGNNKNSTSFGDHAKRGL